MLTIFHGGFEWVMAGFVVFFGLMVFAIKLIRGHMLSTIISMAVWVFVFTLHKGSTAGIMTATLAALLFDTFGMPLFKLFGRKHHD